MRKIRNTLICLIALFTCVSLCACGKSEAATNVDNMILEIGEVTLDSGDKITAAEEAASDLQESEYNQLEELSVLKDARETYDQLVKEDITEIENAINTIGTVTLEKKSVIINVRDQYNQANADVKAGVKNYEALEQAETQLSSLKVQNVIELIDQIGQVTLNSEEKINTARTNYNMLSYNEQKLVTNYAVIETATKRLQELKDREKQEAIAALQTETDKVEGITWYKPSTYPRYADTRSYILPYIGKNNSSTWLRLQFHYTGNNWIFFQNITIAVDGNNYYKTFGYGDVQRDNDTEVWEWVDIAPTNADIEMLEKIANSTETIVRFQGDNYYYDLTVKDSDKTAIKQVLLAYEALKTAD